MSRNFPTWDQTHWDYEKGNLDAPTKRYAVEAARRVKAHGGVIHFFAVGQTMEQEDVSLAARDRRAGPSRRQSHIRSRQREGDALRGHSVSVSPSTLADRREDAGRCDRREYSSGRSGPQKKAWHRSQRVSHSGRICQWPGRPGGPSAPAARDGLHLGEQPVSCSPDRRHIGQETRRRRSWPGSSLRRNTRSPLFTHRAWWKYR